MNGPDDGYDSSTKRRYRQRAWNLAERLPSVSRVPHRDRVLLILDEWQAHESRFLIEERDYRPDQIHVAQLSPAKAARVTLSLKQAGYVGVRTHSKGLGQACEDLAKEGIAITAVHADFCANITSLDLLDALCDIRQAVPETGHLAVIVNMLRGRETEMWRYKVESFKRMGAQQAEDAARIRMAVESLGGAMGHKWASCQCHVSNMQSDKYNSTNGQSFLFLVAELETHGRAIARDGGAEILRVVEGVKRHRLWSLGAQSLPWCATVAGFGGRQSFTAMIENPMTAGASAVMWRVDGPSVTDRLDRVVQKHVGSDVLQRLDAKLLKRYSKDPKYIDNVYANATHIISA